MFIYETLKNKRKSLSQYKQSNLTARVRPWSTLFFSASVAA